MRVARKLQVLALLACGLATAPLGSFEQSGDTDAHAAVLRVSADAARPVHAHAPNWRANLAVRPVALPLAWTLTVSDPGTLPAVILPVGGRNHTLSYYATAPPY